VRGIGLSWGVELVKNQQTKEPFNTWQEKLDGKALVVDQVAAKMLAQGVVMQAWMSHFVLAPPLIVEKEQIDTAVAALDDALNFADGLL
jgi:taurine--2-oxoglutarate transaminase